MYIDTDKMRLRAALDTAVQRSFARYLGQTERAREDFKRADEELWRKYYPWYVAAVTTDAKAIQMAAYKRELQPWAAAYDQSITYAEHSRSRDKAQIDEALAHPQLEEKIRLLARI